MIIDVVFKHAEQVNVLKEAMDLYQSLINGPDFIYKMANIISTAYQSPTIDRMVPLMRIVTGMYDWPKIGMRDKRNKCLNKIEDASFSVREMKRLELSGIRKEDMQTICRALDFYSRIIMGQWHEVDSQLRMHGMCKPEYGSVPGSLWDWMKYAFFGFSGINESYGILCKENGRASKVSYEMLKWIDSEMYKDDGDISSYSVRRDKPLRCTDLKEITVTIRKEVIFMAFKFPTKKEVKKGGKKKK